MLTFIEENCLVFDNEDENKFEYTKLHNVFLIYCLFYQKEFKNLFEKLFGELLTDLGITEEQFVKACEDADKKEENKKYITQILSVDDFLTFKSMMHKRNIELNEQAMKSFFI